MSSPFLNMILQFPPFAVLKVSLKGCNALLNIDDSEGTIPVMSTPGVRGDRIGYRWNIVSVNIRLRNFLIIHKILLFKIK